VIPPEDHERLLRSCNLGYLTAEEDEEKLSLPESRILLPSFYDMLDDRVDHIRGSRGSGKSALLYILRDYLESPKSKLQDVFCVPLIPPRDNPIISQLQEALESLNQAELNNFWSLYLLIFAARAFEKATLSDSRLRELRRMAQTLSKMLDRLMKRPALGTRAASWLRGPFRIRFDVTPSPTGPLPGFVVERVEVVEGHSHKETIRLIRVAQKGIRSHELIEDLKGRLTRMLETAGLRVWLLFDGLDRCFSRRTNLEREAILSLLRCSYHLGSSLLRVKLFVRDDILRDLSSSCGGLVDFPRIIDRMTPPLKWGFEDILILVLVRVFSDSYLAGYFNVSHERLRNDPKYREHLLSLMIPRVRGEVDALSSFKWAVQQCSTAGGVATPRDVIEFFKLARDRSLYLLKEHGRGHDYLFPADALQYASNEISISKTEAYLNNDFADLRPLIASVTLPPSFRKLASGQGKPCGFCMT